MDINCLTLHVAILLVATFCPPTAEAYTSEQKGPSAQFFCGELFVKTWTLMCKLKKIRMYGRKKRSLEEVQRSSRSVDMNIDLIPGGGRIKLKRLHDILDSNVARTFLTTSLRTRRQVETDNATEECCNESCTYAEISGYSC